MFLILPLYFGTIFYLVKKVLEKVKQFEENIDPFNPEDNIDIDEINYNMDNIKIDKENILYQAFDEEINKNQLDISKKVLICCTGDNQSMALLTIAMNVFNRENIHVFTSSNNDKMTEFIENICIENKLAFHITDNMNRYNIKEICEKNDISYIFEGHTLSNNSNIVLNNIFMNKTNTNNNNIYRPFLLIDETTLLRFVTLYNLPTDENLTHYFNSKGESKRLFNNIDQYLSILYPNWRLNIIENYNHKTILNVDKLQKDTSIGKYGFTITHDFDKISFIMFKKLVDGLLTQVENNIIIDNLETTYINNTKLSVFVCEEYLNKINTFENFLQSINLQDLIDDLIEAKSNCSDCSFEELEINNDNTNNADSDDSDNSDDSADSVDSDNNSVFSNSDRENNDIEYILKVDIDNHDIKLIDKISDTLEYDYINGIIYISIKNNDYHIFSAHNNTVEFSAVN